MNFSKIKKSVCLFIAAFLLLSTAVSASASAEKISSLDDLKGAKVGVLTGTIFDKVAEENIENVEVCYFNTNSDIAVALDTGKIDAYVTDEPIARSIQNTYSGHKILEMISSESYGFIFQKDNQQSSELCRQFNRFIAESKENGLLEKIDAKWFGADESAKTIDYSAVENNSGKTLRFAISTNTGVPFTYLKDGRPAGYDVEVAVEFCKANGYKIKIDDYEFAGIMSSVQAGMDDFGASCITITEERKESMLFSDPDYVGGTVVVIKDASASASSGTVTLESLKGAKIGVLTGTIFDGIAKENIEDPVICYYNSDTDVAAALDAGKIDAYVADAPIVRNIQNTYPDQIIIKQISAEDYGYVFQKDNPESAELCAQLNEFIAESKENGLIDKIDAKWFGTDESVKVIDYESLEKNTGKTLKFATSTNTGEPFTYLKDGKPAGYDIDLAVEFCKAYGYRLKIDDYDFSGIMSAVQAGIDDFGASNITITEERKENMLFSDPNYAGGTVVVIKESKAAVADTGFFASVKDSFIKTFVRESRWKLFINGIVNTLFITILSILFGTIIGFIDYMVCRKGNKIANSITKALIALVQGMPVVVLLMILFYIILGKSGLDGKWVAIIGFSLTFGASVFGMLKTSVGAIDKGQSEAAFALGFSNLKTFFRVILPQASYYFLPMFRSEVVAHIKATAIVGYIAVQDLTKISDIVRTRTYEAFFPLIATAIIYFLLEGLLVLVVKNVQFFADKKRRTPEKILKGIETK